MSLHGEFRKSAKTKRTTLAHAFRRLLRCSQLVAKAIPDERLIWTAHDVIGWTSWKLIEGSNSTNLLHIFISGDVQEFDRIYEQKYWAQDSNKNYARSLTKEQCELLTLAFNHYSHHDDLSDREISHLKPIISTPLRAVMVGSCQMLRYFQEHEKIGSQNGQYSKSVLDVPERCSSKFIYLRDRREDDGD